MIYIPNSEPEGVLRDCFFKKKSYRDWLLVKGTV
jgi:hypothetical protein